MVVHTNEQQVRELEAIFRQVVPNPEMLVEADGYVRMLVLSQGVFQDGTEYYAYLAVPPSKYIELMKLELRGKGGYKLSDFGEVLEWAEGTSEPSEDVRKQMAKEYGANPNFATDLLDMMQKTQAAQEKDSGES